MKFNLAILRHYLLNKEGILPERVTLETNFKTQLRLSDEAVKSMLAFVSKLTGVIFPRDASYYLTDVFDLMIHVMIRSDDVDLGDEYFNGIAEPKWQAFLHTKLSIPIYTYLN